MFTRNKFEQNFLNKISLWKRRLNKFKVVRIEKRERRLSHAGKQEPIGDFFVLQTNQNEC